MPYQIFFCFALIVLTIKTPAHAHTFDVRVATWNVYDLPEQIFDVASAQRMQQVPNALQKACAPIETLDAIVLTELYVAKDKNFILDALERWGLRYHAEFKTDHLVDTLRLSGIVIVSRWPIAKQANLRFQNACSDMDCFIAKGSLYVRLIKTVDQVALPINLFGTHFYAKKPGSAPTKMYAQAEALSSFIDQQQLSADEPVVVAGDFNAPWHAWGRDVLQTLTPYDIAPQGPFDHTFVGYKDHPLAGSPRQSMQARCQRVQNSVPPNTREGRSWIDYVMAVTPGLKPAATSLHVLDVAGAPYLLGTPNGIPCWLDTLSDHHPVDGTFHFVAQGGD